METKQVLKKLEKYGLPDKIVSYSTKKDIMDLESKLTDLNIEEFMLNAMNYENNEKENKAQTSKNFNYLSDLENKVISNYVIYSDKKNLDGIKEIFINEIKKFKKGAQLIINNKDRQIQDLKSENKFLSEENKILNKKVSDFNNRFKSLENDFQEKEIEIVNLNEKLKYFKEHNNLYNEFYNNFHKKEPLEIIKSYKEKHQGQIVLMEENEDLKETINLLRKTIEEGTEENKKTVKELKEKIEILKFEKKEILGNHTDKMSEINHLNKKIKKLEENNILLHKMLYQIYNKLFDAFRLDKNIKVKDEYLNIKEEDFSPNALDDEELFRYIKIMIASSKESTCNQFLRETVAYANMILRSFLKGTVKLNLRFDPMTTFKELKIFIEKIEDRIKNLESRVKRYQDIIDNNGMYEKKYESMIKSIEEEKINKINFDKKKENFRKSIMHGSFIYKKDKRLIDSNSIRSSYLINKTSQIINTSKNKVFKEENKSFDDNREKKLILPNQFLKIKNRELTSSKNKTNENINKNLITYSSRPQSFSPINKRYKKLEPNQHRILSESNTERNIKSKKYYKNSIYQLLHSLQVTNKNNNSFKDFHYKKLRKMEIGKRGNLKMENGIQKVVNFVTDIKKFISHTNRLFLYKSRMSPKKNKNSEKIKNNVKLLFDDKSEIDVKMKNRIIGKINKLISIMEFEEKKDKEKDKENKNEKQEKDKDENNKTDDKVKE